MSVFDVGTVVAWRWMPKRWASKRTAHSGFTIIELLVVLVIIGILVSLIMPALSAARASARATQCANNLHQIVIACANYSSRDPQAETGGFAFRWCSELQPYLGTDTNVLLCPEDGDAGNRSGAEAGGGGFIRKLDTPPASLEFNAMPDSAAVLLVRERSNYELPRDVNVNVSMPVTWQNNSNDSPKSIQAKTKVDSYILHYDPVKSSGTTIANASVGFGGKILGIIFKGPDLASTDQVLGNPATQYAGSQGGRGLEQNQDVISLSDDMRELRISRFYTTSAIEEIRVITEPGSKLSYGANDQVSTPGFARSGQAFFTDYKKPTINRRNDATADLPKMQDHRHRGRSNVIFADGKVEMVDADFFDPTAAHWPKK